MDRNFIVVFSDIGKGGAEKVVAGLANYLIDKEYRVTFISLGPTHDYAFLNLSNKIEIIHFTRKNKFDSSPFTSIKQVLISNKISFVFCIDFFAQLFMSFLRKFHNLNFKITVGLHTTIPIKKTDYLVNFLGARFLRATDSVIFISKNQQKYITKTFLFNSKCEQKIIYNGIDTNTFKIAIEEEKIKARKRLLDIGIDDILIIQVAGIRIEKDHETAIKSLRFFHDTFAYKPYLIILGDGDLQLTQYLRQLARRLNLSNFVKFIGFNSNVNEYLACSNLFTLTSNKVETFSLAALEAMSCGLPVVLTDIGGASEMVNDFNGFLSKPKDVINIAQRWNLALQSNFSAEVIRNFIVKEFDASKMNSHYYNFFNEISSRSRKI